MAGRRVVPPPNIRAPLTDLPSVVQVLKEQVNYTTSLYNTVRQTVLAVDKLAELQALTQSISNPPTKAEVEAIQGKVNEIIVTANTPIEGGS